MYSILEELQDKIELYGFVTIHASHHGTESFHSATEAFAWLNTIPEGTIVEIG